MDLVALDSKQILSIFYIWVNLVSIVIFTILYIKSQQNKQTSLRYYSNIVLGLIIYFLGDILWGLTYYQIIPNSELFVKFARIIYYGAALFIAYFWFIYVEVVLESNIVSKSNKKWFLIVLSVALIAIVVVCILWDPSLKTTKGFLTAFGLILVPAGFVVISGIQIIQKIIVIHDKGLKKKYITLLVWPIIILASAIGQIIFEALPIFCSGSIIVILSSYIYNQDAFIFTDPLTEINNRNMINRYLKDIKNYNDTYYLLMIDIDNFKSINDTYGHVEGDKALKYMANILKKIANEHNYFLARYGGDEFIMIAMADEDTIKNVIEEIHEKFASTKEDLGYSYSTSVGYTKMNQTDDIDKNIARADKYLYKKKKQLHRKDKA